MSIRYFPLLAALLSLSLSSAATADELPQARDAIQRGLAYVAKDGAAWIAERKCVSCHQVPSMLWSLNDARARGFEVDTGKLEESSDFAFKFCAESKTKEGELNGHGMSTVAQILLGRDRAADGRHAKHLATLTELVVKLQEPDGYWTRGGQPQRRPEAESSQVTTLWMTLAIQSMAEPQPELLAARDRALQWLATATPKQAQSTEWWVARYLVAREFEQTAEAERVLKELLARQHDDGGWGWLSDEASDAFGTGLALYALHYAGRAADDPVVYKARAFLLSTQRDDGSWPSPSTHKKAAGKEDKLTPPTGISWGSAWAVIGLMHTQPAAEVAAK